MSLRPVRSSAAANAGGTTASWVLPSFAQASRRAGIGEVFGLCGSWKLSRGVCVPNHRCAGIRESACRSHDPLSWAPVLMRAHGCARSEDTRLQDELLDRFWGGWRCTACTARAD